MCGYAVEWVRSCKKSKWRLTRGSDRLRPGFYYFSPAGTPFYPGFHLLGSRDWVSGDRNPFEEQPLGEWSGPTEWYDGTPPIVLPLPVSVGDVDCIANGERPGLPIINDACAECTRNLPDACYLSEETLASKTNVMDCVFGWKSAKIIFAAYTDLAAAAAQVDDLFQGAAVVTTFPVVDTVLPSGVIAIVGDTAFIWLTGTSNFQQLAIQGLLFGEGPADQGAYGCSELYEAAATAVGHRLTDAGGGTCTRVVLCGHSYGGAAIYVLAAKMRLNDFTRAIEVLTFGMPKPGDDKLRDIVDRLRQRHYVNELDPIPYAPPRPRDFVELLFMMALGLSLQWARFFRPSQLTVITQDGQLRHTDADLIPDGLLNALLLAQINAASPPVFSDHFVASYVTALAAACPCVATLFPPAPEQPANAFEIMFTDIDIVTPQGETTGDHTVPVSIVAGLDWEWQFSPSLSEAGIETDDLLAVLPQHARCVLAYFDEFDVRSVLLYIDLPEFWWHGVTLLNPTLVLSANALSASIGSVTIMPQ